MDSTINLHNLTQLLMKSYLECQNPIQKNIQYSCVRKKVKSKKIIDQIIKITELIENLDIFLEKVVDILGKNLQISGCIIKQFKSKNIDNQNKSYIYFNSESIYRSNLLRKIANDIFNQTQLSLSQDNLYIKLSPPYIIKSIKKNSFIMINFPLVYKKKVFR